jgi:hypothetical protein
MEGWWLDRHTDRHDEAISHFSQFIVNVPKNGNIFYSQKSVKEVFQL